MEEVLALTDQDIWLKSGKVLESSFKEYKKSGFDIDVWCVNTFGKVPEPYRLGWPLKLIVYPSVVSTPHEINNTLLVILDRNFIKCKGSLKWHIIAFAITKSADGQFGNECISELYDSFTNLIS